MTKNQRLQLSWIGKEEEPIIEPRILIENPEYNAGADNSDDILIHGDNLLALKALEHDFSGKVRCIYIDPPYNTGNAFEHYDDNLEHSIWLNLMKSRLKVLKNLLSNDGSIWISIDSDESHYLKVLCDEVFGRSNFIEEVIWQRSYAPINLKKTFSRNHDTILSYAKNKEVVLFNKLERTQEANDRFSNPDNDPRGKWASGPIQVGPRNENRVYKIVTPGGREVLPPAQYCWRFSESKLKELIADNRIYFGKDGNNVPRVKRFLSEVKKGIVPLSLWLRGDVGDNQEAKKEIKVLFKKDVFDTPKPERLLERIIHIASKKGDIVLDSFLGSGTTTAVAQKMGRKFIGIEMGDHAYTHCFPRQKMVTNGEDQGGISKSVNWQGGGGFKFYELAPSLLNKDQYDNWVISKEYNANMLAAAMAKQEGFSYSPNTESYWKQGFSSEQDFIYTTTQFVTVELLDQLNDQLQEGESLLICAKKFQPECANRFGNISLKKIPQMLLGKCEFAKDDYSLNIINLPQEDDINETEE